MQEQPLAHWSLAAIEEQSRKLSAIYHPDGDHEESLELNYSEKEMIEAMKSCELLLRADVLILEGYAREYFWAFFQFVNFSILDAQGY